MSRRTAIFLIIGLTVITGQALAEEPLFHSISVKPETPVEGRPFAITYVASLSGVISTRVTVSDHVIKLEPDPTHLPWPPLPWTVSIPGLPAGNYMIQLSMESEFFGTIIFETKPLVIAPTPVPAFGSSVTILLATALAILGALAARRG